MHRLAIEIVHSSPLTTFKDVVELLSAAILGILAIAAYIQARNKYFSKDIIGFQAIFLTNGQVYFGKITDTNNDYITMENIYYLQNTVNESNDMSAFNAAINSDSLNLVKLGNELHGPSDVMHINKSQIIFWENIKDDGKVMQAINEYEKKV